MKSYSVKNESGQAFEVDEDKVVQAEKDGFLPVVSNGKEEHRVSVNDLQLAEQDGFKPVYAGEKPSILASALRKGAQGALFSSSDELSGGLESAGRAVGLRGVGGPLKDISLDERGPTLSMDNLKAAYQQGRDEERERLKLDSETNPVTSNVAEIGTAILSPVNKIAKGMSLIKGGAVLGGAQGLGSSEKESTIGNIADGLTGAGVGAVIGKGAQKLSAAIAPTSAKLAEKISPAAPKKNTQEIIEAAKRLNINVTPGMLDDTGFVQRLEYTLANSPSIMGQSVNRNQKAVVDALEEGAKTATKEASSLSPNQIGERFKSGLTQKVSERLDPISAVFDEVAQSTKSIEVSQKSKDAIIRNIQKLPEFRLSGGKGKIGEYTEMIGRITNADDAKTVMTMLNGDVKAAMGSERLALMAIKDKVATLEKNSIMRSAIEVSRQGGAKKATGETIGREIVGDLKMARSEYRQLATDLGEIAENTRVRFQGPKGYLDQVEDITSEKIQQKFFNTDNLRQIENLKSKFPEQFELLKQGKLQEIAENSMKPVTQGDAGVSPVKFINEINKLNPEVKKHLFGDAVQLLGDIETVQRSMPKNFNPSGTGSQNSWSEALYRNAKDIPNYLLYKGASTNLGKKAVQKLQTPDFTGLQNKAAGTLVKAQVPATIGSVNAVKGVDKWIANGEQKVIENDASIDPAFLKQYKNSKEGRSALIRAGELKPGSNQLNQTIDKIKSSPEYKQHLKQKEKAAQGKEPDQSSVKPKQQYPKVVRKDGYTAVVRNDDDLAEAKSEGWA